MSARPCFYISLVFTLAMMSTIQTASACACCDSYKVVRVASDDVLNVRSGPSHKFKKVGELAHNEQCIFKTGQCKRRWCEINSSLGVKGWVNTRYLKFQKVPK